MEGDVYNGEPEVHREGEGKVRVKGRVVFEVEARIVHTLVSPA